jgi:hypothetical protein
MCNQARQQVFQAIALPERQSAGRNGEDILLDPANMQKSQDLQHKASIHSGHELEQTFVVA